MKIRNGFVSNSSSSSFILFGFTVIGENKNYKEICEKYLSEDTLKRKENDDSWEDFWWDYSEEIKGGLTSIYCESIEGHYIGKTYAQWNDYLEEEGSITVEELKKLEEKINKLFPGEKCELHFGTVAS